MSEVFDLDALAVEAEDEPFRFTFKGYEYEMPLASQMDFRDQLSLEDATAGESLEIIMGTDQYERLIDAPITAGLMEVLLNRWLDAQGLEPGKSRASSPRSAPSGGKSRRTSRVKRK